MHFNYSWLNTRFAGRNTGAYSFQNAFFYLQFADDVRVYDQQSSNPALRAALLTQRKTRRFVVPGELFLEFRWIKNNYLIIFSLYAFDITYFVHRRSKLHPQKQRSKYICKPEAVVEAGNHFVWEFVPGKGTMNVPADAGILHHYRVSILKKSMQNCWKSTLALHIVLFLGVWIRWWRLHQSTLPSWSHRPQISATSTRSCRDRLQLLEATL